MSKVINTDFLTFPEEISSQLVNNDFNSNESGMFLYTMDDCTHLDFSNNNSDEFLYLMDDCTNLDFSDNNNAVVYSIDDCNNLNFN